MRYNVFQMSWNVLDCYLLIIAILSICPLLIGLVPESICTIMSVFTLSVTEVKWPYQSPEWVYSPLDSCKQRPASKAGIFATPICTTGRIISHLADRTTAMYLRLKCLRKVSSLTKKAAKSMIPHGFAAWLDGEIDGYSIMVRFSRSIFFFFNSKDECTYLFSVIFTLECPKISLRLLISNPSSTHLVAKVCLSAW